MRFIPRKVPEPLANSATHLRKALLRQVTPSAYAEVGADPVAGFEERYAALVGRRHAIATGGARVAFVLWARAMGLPPGAGVVVPSYTAPIVPAMVRAAGLTPIPAAIEASSFNLDPERLPVGNSQVRVVLVPHTEGVPARIDEIVEVARAEGWLVVEDCAHGVMSRLHGRLIGSFGDAAYTSFGKGKQLNAVRGGLLVCDDDELALRIRHARDQLARPSLADALPGLALDAAMGLLSSWPLREITLRPLVTYPRLILGVDLLSELFEERGASLDLRAVALRRMPDLYAAIGRDALDVLAERASRRHALAERYREQLGDRVRVQTPPPDAEAVPLEFSVVVDERERVQQALLERGIDTQRTWMIDWTPGSHDLEQALFDPEASLLQERCVYLPVYPAMEFEDVDRVASKLLRIVKSRRIRRPKRKLESYTRPPVTP